MFTCSKKFIDFPFAHRQPAHKGHCKYIHGHNWAFEFTFACEKLDDNGFVIDFGTLGWLKTWLTGMFDHTLVLNDTDPLLQHLQRALTIEALAMMHSAADIRTVPNCGAEGLAEYIFRYAQGELARITQGRVFLTGVQVFEDSKNSATFWDINARPHA